MKIGKYLAIARVSLQNSFVYRIDSLFWGTGELIDTLVFLFIWIKIFGEKQAVAGFTLPETITYLIWSRLDCQPYLCLGQQ